MLGRSSAFFLLWSLHWAGISAQWCRAPELRCDWVCDCDDCSDEQRCGYNAQDWTCDFEDSWTCGWSDPSSAGSYRWERLQADALTGSGPSADYTSGTATGWFMGVSAVKATSPRTAVLISPEIKASSATCQVRLRYFLWDSGLTDLGSAPLWASIHHQDSREAVIWRPEPSGFHGWREASIFVGRVSAPFRLRFYSRRLEGGRADVAMDHLEFLNCALPQSLPGQECPRGMLSCKRGGCVEQRQVCDGTDDCGDGTDEESCDYQRCDFEEDICDWDLLTLSDLVWVRTNQITISTSDPMKGPGRDQSTNSASGHFLYVTVPDTGLKKDWASFQSPWLQPTNSSHPCKMVMYTHQFGPRSGGLTVMVVDRAIYPVWERGGSLGDLWVKAEVEIFTDTSFKILIMAAVRNFSYGGIAIDSIQLSPECRRSSENTPLEVSPKPPKEPCAPPELMCNFHSDCAEAADEAQCGDFLYPEGSSGWTDSSLGNQRWTLFENSTDRTQDYLGVTAAAGQQLTGAQTRTPLLGPSGPACALSFDFALTGSAAHVGELSVRVMDTLLGPRPKLWEFGGSTGTEHHQWKQANIPVGARKQRFQLAFEARARDLSSVAPIRVRNVRFLDCHAGYFPSSPTGLTCNFDEDLCGWYQDSSDSFDWTVLSGRDHTIGHGRSLAVDMWSPSLHGAFGRLLSVPLSPGSSDRCLYFYYKLYGSNPGALNVKLLYKDGHEAVLWTRRGDHGNVWLETHCFVPHQITDYQVVFEAVRSGSDGHVAIDDVAFLERPCGMPTSCSFEEERCGYKSSGAATWLHLRGGEASTSRPAADHTLETKLGSYMLVDTSGRVLPAGAAAVLTSAVRQGLAKTQCVSFYYHMGGHRPGSLTVYLRPGDGERVQLFSSSDSGQVWRHGNSNISSGLVDWQLEFEVIGAGGEDSHVAIDDVTLSPHPCEDPGRSCGMEGGSCGWRNTQNTEQDELDWVLTSTRTEPHYPTPAVDHTLSSEEGHFLLLPSSERTGAGLRAHFVSTSLPATKGTCLRFWAYSSSTARRQLTVWTLTRGRLQQLVQLQDLEPRWKRFDIDVLSSEEYQLVIEGVKSPSGFLALDDIEFTIGISCANILTDSQEPSPDNAGSIAASVIVVLLLVVTLVALLVYYLRSRRFAGSRPSRSSSTRGGFTEDEDEDEGPDRLRVPSSQNRPEEAGFSNISIYDDVTA